MINPVRPAALRSGDRVAVLTMSSPADQALLDQGLAALRSAGLEPVVYDSARDLGSERHYLAGSDRLRADDLRSALLDDSIAGVLFACGGYGAQRALEVMDWSGVAGARPKVLAGYSDVTAVLEAALVKLGWSSLMSLMVSCSQFTDPAAFAALVRCLTAPQDVPGLAYPEATTVVPGRATGVTMGGNLALLSSSIGSDTSLPAAGGIWLVEDVEECDYRIDRMLTQLRRSGYLDSVAGIVAGTWHQCGEREQVHPVLVDRLADLGVPFIAWANVGHGISYEPFPIGVRAELDAEARTLRFLDPPLTPAEEPIRTGSAAGALAP